MMAASCRTQMPAMLLQARKGLAVSYATVIGNVVLALLQALFYSCAA